MTLLNGKHSWLAAPLLWLIGILLIVIVWHANTPEWIYFHFDNDGVSPVESATVGLFFFQMFFFWLLPPMRPSRLRPFWFANFSLLSFFAICRELDWHRLLIKASNLPGATSGTPYKMRFITNSINPLSDRLIVLTCFVVVIALCGGTLLYFLPRLWRGLFKMHPVCWSMGFFGGTIILIHIVDRAPSILRKNFNLKLTPHVDSLMSALEEGQELMLPLFIIIAVIQAYFIYNVQPCDKNIEHFQEM